MCVCTHLHTCVYLSGHLKQGYPLLGHYLHSVVCCVLKGVIADKWFRWKCGTKMTTYQEYLLGVAITAHEYMCADCDLVKSRKHVFVVIFF